MPIPIRFKEALYDVSGYLVESLEGMSASIEGLFAAEHNADGTHKSVKASAITLNGNAVNATTSLTPTLADVDNTTTPTVVLSFTLGANIFESGDRINILLLATRKQNSGANRTVTTKLLYGATSLTIQSAESVTDLAGEGMMAAAYTLIRDRGVLYVIEGNGEAGLRAGATWNNTEYLTMTPDFTVASTVSLEVTLEVADADFYLRPDVAVVDHFHA